jgi:nucleotide-binding universal stress UspA family protein
MAEGNNLNAPAQPVAPQSRASRSIVVGIDGSTESHAALHWALHEAAATGAEIDAVAVCHEPIQLGISAQPPVPRQAFTEEARKWLADATPQHPGRAPSADIHTTVEHGDPSTVLLDHAQRADLLVLGNKGRGGLSAALIGSVALRCMQHARCPTVLVPKQSTMDATLPGSKFRGEESWDGTQPR